MQEPLFAQWNATQNTSIQAFIAALHGTNPPDVLAQHYFVPNPLTGTGVSPKWDFSSSGNAKFAGNPNATIVAKGQSSVPAPRAQTDVNWLEVVNVGGAAGGAIADVVIRSDTVGGQPPATCEYGKTQDISVKYVSKYCEYPHCLSANEQLADWSLQGSSVAHWAALSDRSQLRADSSNVSFMTSRTRHYTTTPH